METRWSLKLEDKAAANAKRIKREVVALNAAMRELQSLAGLTDKALRGMGGGDTSRRLRAQAGLIREQTRALREQRSTQAQRVRDDRAADRQRRRETKQQLDAHAAVARVSAQREQREARARREADGHYAAFQRGERRQAREREQRDAQRQRREAADRRMADGHFAQFQRGEQRAGREREQRVARQSRLDDANRRLADRHFEQFQRGERVSARQREREGARDGRNNQSFFQRLSRQRQQSFRENDRLRRGQARAQLRDVSQRHRAEQRAAHERQALAHRNANGGGLALLGAGARGASVIARGVMSIVSATLSAITAVAGLAAGFAGLSLMIGAALLRMISFRESTVMTLSTLMRVDGEAGMSPAQVRAARGSAARGEFRWASQFARDTPLDTEQVVGLRTRASTAGYQGAEARTMTQAAADAAALHPDDASTGNRFLLQMGQLRNSSRARAADYRPAAQAAGVNEQAAMRRAAEAAGIHRRTGETDPAYQRRVDEAQGRGAITGRQMHDAILAEQNAQLGQSEHGAFARSQATSLAATLSNLGEGFTAFVTSIEDIENLPGILALKAMLREISDTLAGTTRNGKDLQAIFAQVVNFVAGAVGTMFGPGGFDGALTSAMATARELWPIVRAMVEAFGGGFMEGFAPLIAEVSTNFGRMRANAPGLVSFARDFGRGLAMLAVNGLRITQAAVLVAGTLLSWVPTLERIERLFASIGEYIPILLRVGLNPGQLAGDVVGSMIRSRMGGGPAAEIAAATASDAVRGQFDAVGADMGRGVARGFRSQQAYMQSEVSSVMGSLPTQARSDLQIKSPSRVFAEIGEYAAMGMSMGIDSGAADVQRSMSSMVAPPSLPGFGGASGGLGGGASITIGSVTFQVSGAPDAGDVTDQIRSRMEELFVGAFERVALAGGA